MALITVLAFVVWGATTTPVLAAPGDLDPSFGNGGKVITHLPTGNGYASTSVVQPDGKLIVAGAAMGSIDGDAAVVRYNLDGSLDTSFGTGGVATADFGTTGDHALAVGLNGNKIVIAGFTQGSVRGSRKFAMARHLANGSLDHTFGTNGVVVTDFGKEDSTIICIHISTTKIIAAGWAGEVGANGSLVFRYALARYNMDGSLDSTFGSGGKVITPVGLLDDSASGIAMLNGNIIVSGFSYTSSNPNYGYGHYDFCIVCYKPDGSLNTSFGTNGIVITDFGGTHDASFGMLVVDGKIVLGGTANPTDNKDFALARYHADGRLDTTFGQNGKVVAALSPYDDWGWAIALDGNRLIVAGTTSTFPNGDFGIMRFNADGSVDTTFGRNGKVITNFGAAEDYCSMAMGNEGFYVAGPTSNSDGSHIAVARYLTTGTPTTTYNIRGRVANDNGIGMAGINVSLSNGRQVSTDANGYYLFSGITNGSYTVAPVMTAGLSGVTFTPGQLSVIVNGTNAFNHNFNASFSISGRVTNSSGAGMASVQVLRTSGASAVGTFTDSNGNYSFGNVRSGSYTIAPVIAPSMAGISFNPMSRNITNDRSNISNQSFIAGFTITGRVANHSGVGIPNAQVQRVAGTSVVSTFTDSSGNYRFTGVRSGSYTLAPVLTPAMSGMSFTPVSKPVTVDRNNLTNQNFIGMMSISGRVTTSAGVARASVLVRLNASGGSSTSALTDSNGNYRFSNVRSGSYTIVPELSGVTPVSRNVTINTLSLTNQNFTG